jgi:hypothetical protein
MIHHAGYALAAIVDFAAVSQAREKFGSGS